MADVKFSQFQVGGPLVATDEVVGLRAGVNTIFDSPADPSGPFLLKAANLSDVQNKLLGFVNLGFGSGDTLNLNDADFTANVYQLPVPCPNYVFVQCLVPGNQIRLPIANIAQSPQISQGPIISLLPGSQIVDVGNQSGISILPLGGGFPYNGARVQYTLDDDSTANGLWNVVSGVTSINDVTGQAFLLSAFQTVYVANSGSDTPGVGSGNITEPYATLSYALSQITDASSSKPYQIIMSTGVYTEINVNFKPWIYIEGGLSDLTVSGAITLDPTWSGGGGFSFQNFAQLAFPATVNFDFDAVNAGFVFFRFSNNGISSGFNLNLKSDPAGTLIAFLNNNFGTSSQINYTITDCYGAVSNGATNDINIVNTSDTTGGNFNVQGLTVLGNLSITTSSNSGIQAFVQGCTVIGTATYSCTGAGNNTSTSKAMTYFGGVTLDKGVGGGVVNLQADLLTALPTLLNSATYTPTSIAEAMRANANFSPANYIPVAGVWDANSVVGNLAGIDAAIAGATGVPPAYAEMFFQGNATVTTIAAANTPVKVDATYSSGILSGFSQATGTLTYTDTPARTVIVSADLTASYAATAQNTSFYIALNGAVVAKSKQSTYIGAVTPANQANPCKAMLSIVTGDTLEVWAENNDNTDDIIVYDLNVTVQSIAGFDAGSVVLAGENYLALLGNTLTANPVNLSGTNVTGLLPLANVADVSTTINGMSINGTSGVNPGSAIVNSMEMRVGNLVTGSILISFNSQSLTNLFTITKSYGANFANVNQALGSGICNQFISLAPPLADGSVCTRVNASTLFGVRFDTTVTNLSTDYLLEATFQYEVV